MKVVEIFTSIDGEGIRTGMPTTFIRLFGCNLHCSYCDTRYACEEEQDAEEPYKIKTAEEIVDIVMRKGIPNVTVTGGEPLIQPGIEKLLDLLLFAGCNVNVETNGTCPVPVRYRENKNIFFTMDYKCLSSGCSTPDLYCHSTLRDNDVLKFVVGSQEDLDQMLEVLDCLESNPAVFVSPVFKDDGLELQTIVQYLLKHKLYDVRMQVQLHKIIWPANQRGV